MINMNTRNIYLKIFTIIFITCLIFSQSTFAQTYYLFGDKTFGGALGERRGNIVKTGDFEFVVAGESASNLSGDKTAPLCDTAFLSQWDLWILKVDTAFNIIWQSDFGGNRQDDNTTINYVGATSNLLYSCRSKSDSACDKSEPNRSFNNSDDYWVGELDLNGNLLWDKTLGGTLTDEKPRILKTPSSDCIVCGLSNSPISGEKTVSNFGINDIWCLKLDSVGNKIWDKVYGGILNEYNGDDNLIDVIASNDNNIFIIGTTESSLSGNVSDTSNGNIDIWVIKIDTSGNIIWDKLFGGDIADLSNHTVLTNDNGLIICGSTYSQLSGDVSEAPKGNMDIWVIKIDSLGNKQWDKRYGGTNISKGKWIEKSPDGGYWIAGTTNSDSLYDVSEPGYGLYDYWVIKIDSVGNKLWDRRFGGPGDDLATSFIILADSSIMLYGTGATGTSTVKTDNGKGASDYWLVHFKYGNFSSGIPSIIGQNQISVFPNPSSGIINIPDELLNSELIISDVTGRLIFSQTEITSTELHFEFLPTGYYFLQFNNNKCSYYGKWLKI